MRTIQPIRLTRHGRTAALREVDAAIAEACAEQAPDWGRYLATENRLALAAGEIDWLQLPGTSRFYLRRAAHLLFETTDGDKPAIDLANVTRVGYDLPGGRLRA